MVPPLGGLTLGPMVGRMHQRGNGGVNHHHGQAKRQPLSAGRPPANSFQGELHERVSSMPCAGREASRKTVLRTHGRLKRRSCFIFSSFICEPRPADRAQKKQIKPKTNQPLLPENTDEGVGRVADEPCE